MTFWNSLKPVARPIAATSVELSPDQRTLSIQWTDGQTTPLASRHLRQYCPCAECVEEWSGRRTYDVETISPDMKVIEVQPVGNYALTFTFGDLHRTGIFKWDFLRELAAGAPKA